MTQAATTVTPAPAPVVAAPAPVKTVATTATAAPAPQHVTLVGQLQAVDPSIYAALVGAIVLPLVHQGVKRLADRANRGLSRQANYMVATVLSGVVGVLLALQSNGSLSQLHNPVLAAAAGTAISFFCGQNVYGLYVKTKEDLEAAQGNSDTADAVLPATTTP